MAHATPHRTEGAAACKRAEAAVRRGDHAAAAEAFADAAAAEPRRVSHRYNLGVSLARLGRRSEAVSALTHALALAPDNEHCFNLLDRQLRLAGTIDPATVEPRGLLAALRQETHDRQPAARAALACAMARPALAAIIELGRSAGWDAAARRLLAPTGKTAITDPLLLAGLSAGINTDRDLERLLAAARRVLLLEPPDDLAQRKPLFEFAVVLARQTANDEHIWPAGTDEDAAVTRCVDEARRDVASGTALLRACLYASPRDILLTDPHPIALSTIMPLSLRRFVVRDLAERAAETAIAARLETIGTIGDATSRAVAVQYEANPYPRWLGLPPVPADDGEGLLAPHVPPAERVFCAAPFDLLVAGCGTGRQALTLARRFASRARVLAVDISRASLAYAARMAEALAIENVRFACADILSLKGIDRRFAMISCVGVLHHMADPLAGLEVLEERLTPGGLMQIGLYSAAARRDIAALRARNIDSDMDGSDPNTLRAYRADLRDGPDWPETQGTSTADLYALSSFRDALCHVEEHGFSIPEISAALDTLGLEFRGFTMPPNRIAATNDGRPPTSLADWQAVEAADPSLFRGMYLFWCRKPD